MTAALLDDHVAPMRDEYARTLAAERRFQSVQLHFLTCKACGACVLCGETALIAHRAVGQLHFVHLLIEEIMYFRTTIPKVIA